MKKKILVSMYSLNIGGAERSLIGLLENFDYSKYEVDLFLYRKEGEFIKFIPNKVNVLPEIKEYTTFERPIITIIKEGHIALATARLTAKIKAKIRNKGCSRDKATYKYMQYMWKYSINILPNIKERYDVAISFLGPHDFIINKVKADKKIGWIHTDYETVVNPDKDLDEKMWSRLNYIINVSEECEKSFLRVFPKLKDKSFVIENILSDEPIKKQSLEKIEFKSYSKENVNLCSVGRLCNAKGYDNGIRAIKLLEERGVTNIYWHIIGYGSDEVMLAELIRESNLENRIFLLGKKQNPYPYIRQCDIYIQPSRYEGKAVTVTEAKILGKPVMITNYATASSQVDNYVDGYITELSVEGIADGIEKLYKDNELREKLSNNCKQVNYGNNIELEKLYELF